MSLNITFKPLPAVWPKSPTKTRRRSPFKYRWEQTLNDLERELRHLGAADCSVALDVQFGDIRRDGWPRADARPRTPGVIISFTAKKLAGEPVQVYPCDTFAYWQDNLVAIVRSLEKLRAVDRYGVTVAGEQYAGFRALPASTSARMTVEQAAEVLSSFSEIEQEGIIAFPNIARMAARIASSKAHPDSGAERADDEAFARVQEAKEVIEQHHGVGVTEDNE